MKRLKQQCVSLLNTHKITHFDRLRQCFHTLGVNLAES